MFTRHQFPMLAACAAVALIGFADTSASARGFGGMVAGRSFAATGPTFRAPARPLGPELRSGVVHAPLAGAGRFTNLCLANPGLCAASNRVPPQEHPKGSSPPGRSWPAPIGVPGIQLPSCPTGEVAVNNACVPYAPPLGSPFVPGGGSGSGSSASAQAGQAPSETYPRIETHKV